MPRVRGYRSLYKWAGYRDRYVVLCSNTNTYAAMVCFKHTPVYAQYTNSTVRYALYWYRDLVLAPLWVGCFTGVIFHAIPFPDTSSMPCTTSIPVRTWNLRASCTPMEKYPGHGYTLPCRNIRVRVRVRVPPTRYYCCWKLCTSIPCRYFFCEFCKNSYPYTNSVKSKTLTFFIFRLRAAHLVYIQEQEKTRRWRLS